MTLPNDMIEKIQNNVSSALGVPSLSESESIRNFMLQSMNAKKVIRSIYEILKFTNQDTIPLTTEDLINATNINENTLAKVLIFFFRKGLFDKKIKKGKMNLYVINKENKVFLAARRYVLEQEIEKS